MAKIRNSSSPPEESSRYVLFDEATVNRLIDAKLTAAQYRTVLYFSLVDPFGNRFVDTGGKMARQRLGISKSTYYEALAVLEREQLFEFEDVSLRVRSRIGSKAPEKCFSEKIVRKIKPKSEISENRPENQTLVQEIGTQSEVSENQSLKPSEIKDSKPSQYHSIDLNQSQNNSVRERNSQIPIFEIETDYKDWLLAKASRFPDPPALRELWLEKQSVNPANLREYDAWQSVQQQIDPLPPPRSPEQSESEDESIAARLARYQRQWAVVPMRKGMQNAIANHPEWHIDIGPDGPRWKPTPPEQIAAPDPEPEPSADQVLHRLKNAIETQGSITPQLQADAERCHIDIPQLQAEWELAASPPGHADDQMRQAG
ncbi:hypothetical protein Lepto7375DRAFT_0997 [Leptolyngbya sp. PCC 7375]|nr:hypothetical protein Lepto7375DRAFT_0997 [Leptolyngbya sp. PCC 7375]